METQKVKRQIMLLRILGVLGVLMIASVAVYGQGLLVREGPVQLENHRDIMIGGKMSTTLKVQVYDSAGNLKDTRIKPDDLLTATYINYLTNFLNPATISSTRTMSATNTANASKTLIIRANDITNSIYHTAPGTGKKGGCIGIGTGSTAPTRADYTLEAQVESWTDMTVGYPTYSTTTGNLTTTTTITATGDYTVSEAGLACRWVANDASENVFLMARDTFTGVAVTTGDRVVITYVINFNEVNFLQYFMKLNYLMFQTVSDGGTGTEWVSTGDYFYTAGTTFFGRYDTTANTNGQNTLFKIGTNSAAVARAQTSCQTPVETGVNPNPIPSNNGTRITIRTDLVCVSARTIQEATFQIVNYVNTVTGIAILRAVFSPVSVPAGYSIRIIFYIDF